MVKAWLGLCALTWGALTWACGSNVDVGSTTSAATGGGGGSTSTGGAGGVTGTGGGGGVTAEQCFEDIFYPITRKYDQYAPVVGDHCKGTNHQDIQGVERVVFLGDSITEGTLPTPASQVYRKLLGDKLAQKFPGAQIDECAVNGAKVRDLLEGDKQIEKCFPGPEERRTLVIMTLGGNDVAEWAKDKLPSDQAHAAADKVADSFRQGIEWFFDDPSKFPNGVYVVFANVYEFTDGTGDLDSCVGSQIIGLTGEYLEGAVALAYLEERYMQIAVDTQTDMIFLLEEFCGHGYHREDDSNSCYRGPDAEQWFDLTCIHPTPAGHAALADLFMTVIEN